MDNQNSGVLGNEVQSSGGMENVVPTTPIPEVNAVNNGMQSNSNVGVVSENGDTINNGGVMSGNIGTVENNGINASSVSNGLSFDLPSVNDKPVNESMNNNVSLGTSKSVIGTGSADMNNNMSMNVNTNNINNNVGDINSNIGSANGSNNNAQTNQTTEFGNNDNMAPVVSVKRFLGYIILFMIPVLGFIMLIVKALDKKDKNISNYAKAQLLMSLISVVLMVVLVLVVSLMISKLTPSVTQYVDQQWNSTIDEDVQDKYSDIDGYNSSEKDDNIQYSIG